MIQLANRMEEYEDLIGAPTYVDLASKSRSVLLTRFHNSRSAAGPDRILFLRRAFNRKALEFSAVEPRFRDPSDWVRGSQEVDSWDWMEAEELFASIEPETEVHVCIDDKLALADLTEFFAGNEVSRITLLFATYEVVDAVPGW